jgi:hypothetical protein
LPVELRHTPYGPSSAVGAACVWLLLPTVAVAVPWQPLAAVMVTLYVPMPTLLKSSVVRPLLHKKVYGATPEVTVRLTPPLVTPEQVTLLATAVEVTEQHPSSVVPEQFSSVVLPHTSEAPGLIAELLSLQSLLLVT